MYKINFEKPIHIHFIGIGGISMSGLAEILLEEGFTVSGSDSKESPLTKKLESEGAIIHYGQCAENISDGIDCVVYTAAINKANPELMEAVARKIPMLTRAELLGQLMKNYKTPIAVSGTHGKTTTTSMISHILLAADLDPTISVGGILKAIGGNIRVGKSETFITEACEYTNSFLHFYPKISVILNIEEDHLDFFKDLADIQHSFRRFAQLVPEGGAVIADGDDANTMDALRGLERPMLTFGLEQGDIHCEGLTWEGGFPSFDLIVRGEDLGRIELSVPGVHNVRNALAAAGAALQLGAPFSAIRDGLRAFRGAGRRFEHKGEFHGAAVYDDYAHHPGELSALLTTARSLGYRRVICAFQPHTYTRTKELFDQFVQVLQLPDKVLLAEIFAARETDTLGISSRDLAQRIPGAEFCPTLEEVARRLAQLAQPGDLILTVGAGDIYLAGERLLADQ